MLKFNVNKYGSVGRKSILDNTINPYDLVISPYQFVEQEDDIEYEKQISQNWVLTESRLKYGSTKSILKRHDNINNLFYNDLFKDGAGGNSQQAGGTIKKKVQFVNDNLPLENVFDCQLLEEDEYKINVSGSSTIDDSITKTNEERLNYLLENDPQDAYEKFDFKTSEIIPGSSSACVQEEPQQIYVNSIDLNCSKETMPNMSAESIVVTYDSETSSECSGNTEIRDDSIDNPSVPPRTKKSTKKSHSNIHAIKIECPKYTSNTYIVSTDENYKVQIKNTIVSNTGTLSTISNTEKKTSILINGDDCYSTINVNNNIPLYHSSVELKYDDLDYSSSFQNSLVITTSENSANCSKIVNREYEPTDFNVNVLCVSNKDVKEKAKTDADALLDLLLTDPIEALRQNLIPHVCGKKTSSPLVLEDPIEIQDVTEKATKEESQPEEFYSDNSVSTRYESLEMNSDYYTDHSNRSSITEDDPIMRTKFYDMLADASTSETMECDDHHYESIKLNCDPIYEDIDVPPPLPENPPPPILIDDLQLDKEYTTRSIFEGASKYDILSYLVDAKERGLVIDDACSYNSENSPLYQEYKDSMSIYSKLIELNNNTDSSEESSALISFTSDCNDSRKIADVERKDSGVGSETSKYICDKYRKKIEATLNCEDCDADLEYGSENEPLLCRKCVKKRSERKEIIAEIVDTEEKYSRDLQIILEEFYQPMLVAGLLTPDQLSAIFLNIEELLENSQALAERLRDAVEIALEQGDEDLLTVNIGKLFLEASPMLHAFEKYCVRQGNASLLLASLEKDKELLRIFLKVSQMENVILRRMNLNSFLMVPVQRVTKYPLLLARLYKVTPSNHETLEQLKEAQHNVELHLNHINSETKDVPSKLWRRINSSSNRKTSCEMDLVSIKLRKIAVDVLEWNHDEAKFILEGKLLFTQPTDNNWRKGRTIKLSAVNALLVTNGKGYVTKMDLSQNQLYFSRYAAVREAALLLVRDKNGRYSLLRDPLYLDRCVVATDPNWKSYFEVQEILGKETYIFKAEDEVETRLWYQKLQYYAQGMGLWRKRRNALANIMISGMGLRS